MLSHNSWVRVLLGTTPHRGVSEQPGGIHGLEVSVVRVLHNCVGHGVTTFCTRAGERPGPAIDRVPGWKLVGHKLSELIEVVVCELEDELDKVLSGLGQKEQRCCESLRRKLTCCFG